MYLMKVVFPTPKFPVKNIKSPSEDIFDNQNDYLAFLNVNLKNHSLFNSANFLDSSSVLKGVIKSFN